MPDTPAVRTPLPTPLSATLAAPPIPSPAASPLVAPLSAPFPAPRVATDETESLRAALRRWRANRTTRRALSRLDASGLADIGLDPATALAESKRFFWE